MGSIVSLRGQTFMISGMFRLSISSMVFQFAGLVSWIGNILRRSFCKSLISINLDSKTGASIHSFSGDGTFMPFGKDLFFYG